MNPTSFPYGSNKVKSTSVLFEDRKLYKEYFIEQIKLIEDYGSKIPFADLYLDNSLYGLVDLNADLIQLKNPNTDLKIVNGYNNENFKLLNFIADAYLDLKEYLNKVFLIGKMPANNFMTEMQIYRAYINPDSYDIVIKDIIKNNFKNEYIKSQELNSSITDYHDFIIHYNNYLINNIGSYPLTKGTSLLSSNFIGFSSGLVFDIANTEADNDLLKYIQFLSTKEFIIFAEACLRFGFRIDVNVPWRLIADLNSKAMYKYYERYQIKNINDVFSKYYKKTYTDELKNIKNFYFDSYNFYIKDNERYHKNHKDICAENSSKTIILTRQLANKEEFYKNYKDNYWIKVYTYFKNLEFQKGLTQTQFDNIVREAGEYCKIGKQERSLKYINDFFKDYNNILYYKSKITIPEEKIDDITNYQRPLIKL